MSRYVTYVDVEVAKKIFGSEIPANNGMVTVAHGYDRPLQMYFADVDDGIGIQYGGLDLGSKMMGKTEYATALEKMGLPRPAQYVMLDIPY